MTRSTPATSSTVRRSARGSRTRTASHWAGRSVKNRTFFFGGFQGNNIREGLTTLLTVPTALMHQGIFTESFPGAPGGGYLRSAQHPPRSGDRPERARSFRRTARSRPTASTRSASSCWTSCRCPPLPTGSPATIWRTRSRNWTTTRADVRVDHNFNSDDRLFGRFSLENAKQYLPTGLPDFGATGGFASNQTFKTRARNIALSQTHIFKNNVINQFTAGYNRIFNYITSFGYLSNKSQELGIPGANLGTDETSSLTRMTFKNFVGIGDRGFSPFQGGTNVFHYADTLTMVKGPHALNIGGTVRFMQLNLLGDTALAGQFTFNRFFTAGFTVRRRAGWEHRQLDRQPAAWPAHFGRTQRSAERLGQGTAVAGVPRLRR